MGRTERERLFEEFQPGRHARFSRKLRRSFGSDILAVSLARFVTETARAFHDGFGSYAEPEVIVDVSVLDMRTSMGHIRGGFIVSTRVPRDVRAIDFAKTGLVTVIMALDRKGLHVSCDGVAGAGVASDKVSYSWGAFDVLSERPDGLASELLQAWHKFAEPMLRADW